MKEKDINSLDHTTWRCQYHVVFAPKYRRNVLMGIITVPGEYAQEVADRLVKCGIKAIWNFAPTRLEVPANILVQYENMATSLALLSMHLQAQMKEKK